MPTNNSINSDLWANLASNTHFQTPSVNIPETTGASVITDEEDLYIPQPPTSPVTQPSFLNNSEYEESANDYHVKYNNCYGILENKVVRALDFYNNDDEDDNTKVVMDYKVLRNKSWFSKSGGIDIIDDIDWTLPYLGAINVLDTVLFIRRRHKQSSPTRYRKALRLDLLDLYEPTKKEYSMLGKEGYSGGSENWNDVLSSIFFPTQLGVEEALDSVLSLDRLGTAISNEYYFTLSNAINNIILWRGRNIIGIWNKNLKGFDISTSLFNDDLNSLGIKWEAA